VINGVTYPQAHNAWLDVYLQLGIIGLIIVGLFVLTTIVRTWSFALDGPRESALLPTALLVAILVQGLAESRLLIEIGWALLVIVSVTTGANRWARR
jgi:exopolysaccharide production protein ExoQ